MKIIQEHLSSKPAYIQSVRKTMKESDFGIPKLKKYPMLNKKDVSMAARGFHKCKPEYKSMLAKNILKKANEYGVNIKDPNILKWARK